MIRRYALYIAERCAVCILHPDQDTLYKMQMNHRSFGIRCVSPIYKTVYQKTAIISTQKFAFLIDFFSDPK